jgi:hypothetical protein
MSRGGSGERAERIGPEDSGRPTGDDEWAVTAAFPGRTQERLSTSGVDEPRQAALVA